MNLKRFNTPFRRGAAMIIIFGTLLFAANFMQQSVDQPQRYAIPDFIASVQAQSIPIPNGELGGLPVFVTATTSQTGDMTLMPAPSTGVRNYIYQAACLNTSSTAAVATIKSGSTVVAYVPCVPSAGSASTVPVTFNPPIRQPDTGTALTMSSSAALTTAYFIMNGYTSR